MRSLTSSKARSPSGRRLVISTTANLGRGPVSSCSSGLSPVAGPEAERGLLEPFDHLAAPEPAELAPLRRRHTVGGKTAGDRREVRAAAQLSEQRVRELQGPRAGGGVGL